MCCQAACITRLSVWCLLRLQLPQATLLDMYTLRCIITWHSVCVLKVAAVTGAGVGDM
jgi:hypothetical protein